MTDITRFLLDPLVELYSCLLFFDSYIKHMELKYIKLKNINNIINQLCFFTMCDCVLCDCENTTKRKLTGLNTLMFYYIVTYFISRVRDIVNNSAGSNVRTGASVSRLAFYIIKIVLEWAKAVIIILCLREQGLRPPPSVLYTVVTWTYYVCTEEVFVDFFVWFLRLIKLEAFDDMESLYASVGVQYCAIVLSSSVVGALVTFGWFRVATFALYHTVYLKMKQLSRGTLHELRNEQELLRQFRKATEKELRECDDVCAVCLNPMRTARVTSCGHMFHGECVRLCCKTSDCCPMCKTRYVTQ